MICYKDMTFCTFYEDCKHKENCRRPLTDAVREGAKKWMGENAPICQFSEKPNCWEESKC